jgi:serine/threonine protein kinase
VTLRERLFGRKKKEDDDSFLHLTNGPNTPEKDRSSGTIGKYDILEKIGSGGFGTVYKAWDPLIKRHVAIKTCEVGNKDIRNRFFREAQLAGGLQHPNITLIYEFGFEGDVPFMVQEFLSGEDLDRMIKRGAPLSLQDKLKIMIGVAFGLEYAHKAGVMHRDIKPANVRVLDTQSVKIMDFGIAKSVDPAEDITQTGITVGSSSYMSPEQIGGDSVDFRTDIFSFGILAYELLSSRKPFSNDNLFLLLEQIVKEPPEPLAILAPELPPALVQLVERAMQKRPEDRFQTAKDLRKALITIQQEVAPAEAALAAALVANGPRTEAARLQALASLEILDTAPEGEFDDLALLASQVCDTPFALISFADRDREWHKSAVGLKEAEVPGIAAFCRDALLQREVVVVNDLLSDPRFADNPLVAGDPKLRFSAAAPLLTPEGYAVGMLCVLDRKTRGLSASQLDGLRALARQVMAQLELRRLRRSEKEQSSEKLMLEAAGLSDRTPGPQEGEKLQ